MNETANPPAGSIVQPSSETTFIETPVASTNLAPTPSTSAPVQRSNHQNGSTYPKPCSYPIAGLAATTPTEPITRSYTFSEPQVVVQGSYATIDGWTDHQEIIVAYQGIEGIFVTLFDPTTHLSTTLPLEKLPRTPVIVYERAPFVLAQSQTPFMHQLRNQQYVPEPLDIASYAQIRPQHAELSYLDQDSSLVLYDLNSQQTHQIGPFNLKNPHNNHSSQFAYSDRKLLWNTSGSHVLVYDDNGLFLINIAEESICTIELGARGPNYRWPMYVAWSPDERYLAITATDERMVGDMLSELIVIDLLTGTMYSNKNIQAGRLAWIPGTADLLVHSYVYDAPQGKPLALSLLTYPYTHAQRVLPNHFMPVGRHNYAALLVDQAAENLYIACGIENAAGLCEIKIE